MSVHPCTSVCVFVRTDGTLQEHTITITSHHSALIKIIHQDQCVSPPKYRILDKLHYSTDVGKSATSTLSWLLSEIAHADTKGKGWLRSAAGSGIPPVRTCRICRLEMPRQRAPHPRSQKDGALQLHTHRHSAFAASAPIGLLAAATYPKRS